jgi:hypothetical protein
MSRGGLDAFRSSHAALLAATGDGIDGTLGCQGFVLQAADCDTVLTIAQPSYVMAVISSK